MKKLILVSFFLISFNTLALTVSGTIVYDRSSKFTHSEKFKFTKDSIALVRLDKYMGEDAGTVPASEIIIKDIKSFPIKFEIATAVDGEYLLSVNVRSKGGKENKVGDLVSEFHVPVNKSVKDITVKVSGLEACDSKNAGGFCTNSK